MKVGVACSLHHSRGLQAMCDGERIDNVECCNSNRASKRSKVRLQCPHCMKYKLHQQQNEWIVQCEEEKAKEQEQRSKKLEIKKKIFREEPDSETSLWTEDNSEKVLQFWPCHVFGFTR